MNKSFASIVDDVTRCINQLPQRVATLAVNFSKQRFVEQNWLDETPEPWKPRSNRRRGGEQRQRGAVLVDSGRLKRSIRVISTSQERIVIGTDVPYAEAHNEGLDSSVRVRAHTRRSRRGKVYAVRAHSRHIQLPKRRFIGASAELEKKAAELINNELKIAIEK